MERIRRQERNYAAFFALLHAGHDRESGGQRAPEIGVHGVFKCIDGLIFDGADDDGAGVVDQHIDGSEHGFNLHGHGFRVFADGYVAGYSQKIFPHPGKFVHDVFEFGLIPGADGDACALFGEFAGENQAPARAKRQ